jgi:hypothetical protein
MTANMRADCRTTDVFGDSGLTAYLYHLTSILEGHIPLRLAIILIPNIRSVAVSLMTTGASTHVAYPVFGSSTVLKSNLKIVYSES